MGERGAIESLEMMTLMLLFAMCLLVGGEREHRSQGLCSRSFQIYRSIGAPLTLDSLRPMLTRLLRAVRERDGGAGCTNTSVWLSVEIASTLQSAVERLKPNQIGHIPQLFWGT